MSLPWWEFRVDENGIAWKYSSSETLGATYHLSSTGFKMLYIEEKLLNRLLPISLIPIQMQRMPLCMLTKLSSHWVFSLVSTGATWLSKIQSFYHYWQLAGPIHGAFFRLNQQYRIRSAASSKHVWLQQIRGLIYGSSMKDISGYTIYIFSIEASFLVLTKISAAISLSSIAIVVDH